MDGLPPGKRGTERPGWLADLNRLGYYPGAATSLRHDFGYQGLTSLRLSFLLCAVGTAATLVLALERELNATMREKAFNAVPGI